MKKSRWCLWFILLAFSISGLFLVFLAPVEGELSHPLNGVLREIHGVSAMLGVFMFGYFFADHAKKKMAKQKHYWDGYLHVLLWILLVATGLLLYYPPEWISAEWVVVTHWYVGVALCLYFPLHFWRKVLLRWYILRRVRPLS